MNKCYKLASVRKGPSCLLLVLFFHNFSEEYGSKLFMTSFRHQEPFIDRCGREFLHNIKLLSFLFQAAVSILKSKPTTHSRFGTQ